MKSEERIFLLHRELKNRRTPLSKKNMMAMFEGCSESTVKRTIRDLKRLGANIYCVDGQGYCYDKNHDFELPGIWFSPEELHALLTIQQLTKKLSGGVFDENIQQIRNKAELLLGKHMPDLKEMKRIRVLGTGSRSKSLPAFSNVAQAVLHRQRLFIVYHGRQRDKQTHREISAQRLVYYRGHWYLDAWCHQANALRSFAVERIIQTKTLDKPCKKVSSTVLDRVLSRSFGIFSGEPTAIAMLHFTEKAARWVADEQWFPDEAGRWVDENTFELRIPYHNPTELIMEICRYGDDVKVIEPPELQQQVGERLKRAARQYS